MGIEEVVNNTGEVFPGVVTEIISEIGKIGLWMQTLGIIVILWIVFQLITFYFNRKRTKAVYDFKKDIGRIEYKLNRIERLIEKK